MSQTTRRQHYVWRYHLAAWAEQGKVAVLRKDGAGFLTNPVNVAVERDFYRLPRLTPVEITFIKRFIDKTLDSDIKKRTALGWLEAPVVIGELRRRFEVMGPHPAEILAEVDAQFDKIEIELDEKIMGNIERHGQPHIERLRQGDASFWPDDEKAAIDFSHFLAVQHLRTKRINDALSDGNLPSGAPVDLRRIWPVMRHVLSTTFGFSLFSERRQWTLRTVRATGRLRFITADQPVVNLMRGVEDNEMALYYPVSPDIAVLLEHPENPAMADPSGELDDVAVHALNQRLFSYSHEQVVGNDLNYLRSLAPAE